MLLTPDTDAAGLPDSRSEDLAALTARAAELAPIHCRGCAHYHGAWPALRLADQTGGLDRDAPTLIAFLAADAAAGQSRRWLIAGMADTGLLHIAAEALRRSGGQARITLVDVCATPLKLAAEYAERHALDVEIEHADLADFVPRERQDAIVLHSVLSHITPEKHPKVVSNLRAGLADGGAFLVASRFCDQPEKAARDAERRPAHTQAVLDAVRVAGVDDAATLERLGTLLPRYYAERGTRRGTFRALPDLLALLEQAGLGRVEILAQRAHQKRRFMSGGKKQTRVILAARAG